MAYLYPNSTSKEEIVKAITEYENRRKNIVIIEQVTSIFWKKTTYDLINNNDYTLILLINRGPTSTVTLSWPNDDDSTQRRYTEISSSYDFDTRFYNFLDNPWRLGQASFTATPLAGSIKVRMKTKSTALIRLNNMQMKNTVWMESDQDEIELPYTGRSNTIMTEPTEGRRTSSNDVESVTRTLEDIQTLVAQVQTQVTEITEKSSNSLSLTSGLPPDFIKYHKIISDKGLGIDKFTLLSTVWIYLDYRSDVNSFRTIIGRTIHNKETVDKLVDLLFTEVAIPNGGQGTIIVASEPKVIVNEDSANDDSNSETEKMDKSSLAFHSCADGLKQLMYKMKRK